MAYASNNAELNSLYLKNQTVAPANPSTGYGKVFVKSDGVYFVDSSGTVVGPLISAASAGGYTQGARVHNAADITVSNSSNQYLTFDSELFDTDTIHDVGSNTGRLTAKTAGKYIIGFHGVFAAHATGYREATLQVNHTTAIADVVLYPGGANQVRLNLTTVYDLAQNDYVEVYVYQNSGGNLTLYGNNTTPNYSPHFWMQRIG
jgi:hypothetical protein